MLGIVLALIVATVVAFRAEQLVREDSTETSRCKPDHDSDQGSDLAGKMESGTAGDKRSSFRWWKVGPLALSVVLFFASIWVPIRFGEIERDNSAARAEHEKRSAFFQQFASEFPTVVQINMTTREIDHWLLASSPGTKWRGLLGREEVLPLREELVKRELDLPTFTGLLTAARMFFAEGPSDRDGFNHLINALQDQTQKMLVAADKGARSDKSVQLWTEFRQDLEAALTDMAQQIRKASAANAGQTRNATSLYKEDY